MTNENKIIQAEGVEFTNGRQSPTPFEVTPDSEIRIRELNDFITFEKEIVVRDTDATDPDKYPVFYLATAPCFLIEARIRHEVNGGANAKVDVIKLPSGTLKANGQSMLENKFSISSGAGTVQKLGSTIVLAGQQLVPGDAMALKATGTLTNTSSVVVGVLLGILTKDIPMGLNITTRLVGT